MGGINPLGAMFGPSTARGQGVPGRQAARAYTDPSMVSRKYAPLRGPLAKIYAQRTRGDPRGLAEQALGRYEGGGSLAQGPLTGASSARVNPATGGAGGGGVGGGQGSITRPLSAPMAPRGLQFGGSDPLQQRTQIASEGLGGSSAFVSPEGLKYYYDLARYSLIEPSGAFGPYEGIQPIEHQFLSSVLGQTVQQPTTQGFLEAVRRGTSSL